jgi:hypothetical protein
MLMKVPFKSSVVTAAVSEVQEKHIFKPAAAGAGAGVVTSDAQCMITPRSEECHPARLATLTSSSQRHEALVSLPPPSLTALSKVVEFPGDFIAIDQMLRDRTVNPAGKDMFGLTALHKFASWNKVDLLRLLSPHLSKADFNVQGE